MPKKFNLIITQDPDVGGYTVECPEMPGCVTEGDTLQELYQNWIEASALWLEGMKDEVSAGRDPLHPQIPQSRELVHA